MKFRNVVYVIVTIICVISIAVAVYYQVFKSDENILNNDENTINNKQDKNIDLEKIKSEFNSIFNNELNMQGYEIPDDIKRLKEDQDIIYTAYEINKKEEDEYSINLNIPIFNVSSEVATNFNKTTQKIFVDKANEIIKGKNGDNYTIYNIDYVSYLNDNILSLVIKATLKEGINAQRLIVQTYNYDLNTGTIPSLSEILEKNKIDKQNVNNKINEYVKYAYEKTEALRNATSENIYRRDLDSEIYKVENVKNFFIGENSKIYIIYAYGNSNFTSEIDIIKL